MITRRGLGSKLVRMAALIAGAWLLVGNTGEAEAKAPGQRFCHNGICHRVMTLGETSDQVGKLRHIVASHYDDCRHDRFNPCGLTSSGEAFHANQPDNAASSIHPDGTILLVRHPGTRQAAVVRVNNFGPFKGNRQLDLSRAAAQKLGFAGVGVAKLEVIVVQAPTAEEARYKRKRRYEAVPGAIGQHPSIEAAFLRYADLTIKQRIARLDQQTCKLASNKRAPRLALLNRAGERAKAPIRA